MTDTATPLEIAQLELATINAGIDQITTNYNNSVALAAKNADISLANYNLQLAQRNNQKAAKETQISTLQAAQ